MAAAVGPITAAPLRAVGLDPLIPDRHRLGALVRAVADHLSATGVREVPTSAGALEVRGQAATLAGRPLALSPAPMAMLRALARRPGDVVGRERLLASLPGAGDDGHAVEVAIGRLRAAIGASGVIQTVVKRGYRLSPREGAPGDRPRQPERGRNVPTPAPALGTATAPDR